MRRSLTTCLALSSAALGTLACSDTTSPAAQSKSYQLAAYGGAALPVTLRTVVETSTVPGGPAVNCDDRLTASSLRLLAANAFSQTESHLLVCDDGRTDASSQSVLAGTYRAAADSLVLSADLGSGISYTELAHITNGGLTIYRRIAAQAGGASSTDPTELVFRDATN